MDNIPVALTIAGSDSGGGAGIQADLRTFSFHCVHGTSIITCVTAQNTQTVTQVFPLPLEMIEAQWEALMSDMRIDALKTGMLLNQQLIIKVVNLIKKWSLDKVVVDPVMVSRAGVQLIDHQAVESIKKDLLPLAFITTPNIYEAELLTGLKIDSLDDMKKAAALIVDLGAKNVLIKGGAREGEEKGVDVWYDGENWEVLTTKAIDTIHTNGTGCTLSAAITANLAQLKSPLVAVKEAKNYVTQALEYSLNIGKGYGPVGHFFPLLLQGN